MPEVAVKKIDVLLELSMHKAKTSELLNFLSGFKRKYKKGDIKELRKRVGKKIPYEEKLSTAVSELREERF